MPSYYWFGTNTLVLWASLGTAIITAGAVAVASIYTSAHQSWSEDQKTQQVTAQSIERGAIQIFPRCAARP